MKNMNNQELLDSVENEILKHKENYSENQIKELIEIFNEIINVKTENADNIGDRYIDAIGNDHSGTYFFENVWTIDLLIKILDASDNLSVQVHPEDDYARENENGELGKTECWYVLDAKAGAKLVYGHTAKTKEEFNDKINREQWQELFIEEEVKAGDFFYIPAGTLHAIGEGILIYEVQQNSDTTYRVYDYDRVDKDGNKRELHIEKTKDVTKVPFEKVTTSPREEKLEGATVTHLADEKYFSVFKVEVEGQVSLEKTRTGNLFTVLNGSGSVEIEGSIYDVKKGDSFILTTDCSKYTLKGNMFLVGSYDR